jgi:hypothetical protein
MQPTTPSTRRRTTVVAVWTFAIIEAAAIGAALFFR